MTTGVVHRRHTVFTLSHSKNLRLNDATHEQRSESMLMHLCNDLFAFILPYFVRAGYAYPSIHGPSAGGEERSAHVSSIASVIASRGDIAANNNVPHAAQWTLFR